MNLQMNLQQWSFVAEIVASVAVVLSLCFLAYEIRMHTLQSRKDSMDLVTSRRFDLLSMLAVDGELAAIVWKGMAGKPRLPADEWARYSLYVYTLLLEYERTWLKAESGSIDDEAQANWEQAMAWWLQHPGIHAWWRGDHPGFDPRFTVYLEEKMTQSRVSPLVSATVAAAFRERERPTQPVPIPEPAPQPATVSAAEPPDQSPPGLG